jgi:pimeloyl-ACP methyl ester carboxylesterase
VTRRNALVRFSVGLLVSIIIGSVSASAQETPSATEFYRRAVVTMNELKEPPFTTFRYEGAGAGLRVDLATEPCNFFKWKFGNARTLWTIKNRTADALAEFVDATGARTMMHFDPSWEQTYRLLRSKPLRDGHDLCSPPSLRNPEPLTFDPKPDQSVKTIGTVLAIGPGIYRVEDRGAAACPSGHAGHALHLSSRTNDPHQQLTDVIVEESSMRFCMVRFGARLGLGFTADAIVEEHFAEVGGYWMQTGGQDELTGRIAGFSTGHGVWRYQLFDMQFPASLPSATFAPTPNDSSAYARLQRLVDIGGRKLNLYCTGTGLPTVILEAGGGDSSLDWRFVQPVLSKTTRTCSYDRAGYGFSDRGPLPRDAAATVSDLHALVAAAGIPKPFVLVGYSNGELYSRLYADRYLGDLAGLVFVEPAAEGDLEARVEAIAPKIARDTAAMHAKARDCSAASENGPILSGSPSFANCALAPDPMLPPALGDMLRVQSMHAGWWTDLFSEISAKPLTLDEVRSEQRDYGALPLAMVTAENIIPPGQYLPAEVQSIRDIVRAARAPLMQLSSRGYQVEAPGCSHGDIVSDCADIVVTAIRAVVAVR